MLISSGSLYVITTNHSKYFELLKNHENKRKNSFIIFSKFKKKISTNFDFILTLKTLKKFLSNRNSCWCKFDDVTKRRKKRFKKFDFIDLANEC